MSIRLSQWILRRKWILMTIGLPVLVVLWWAFRPEKLWINQKVNEPAPFDTSGTPQPIRTGLFAGDAQEISGRATIYRKPSGEQYLELHDFTAPSGSDVHVVLARSNDGNLSQVVVNGGLGSIDLGVLKSNQRDQTYDLPIATDPSKNDVVVIYGEGIHKEFGRAKLEAF